MRTTTPQSAGEIASALVQMTLVRAYAQLGAFAVQGPLEEPAIGHIEAEVTRLALEFLDMMTGAPAHEIQKARPLVLGELADCFRTAAKQRAHHSVPL